MCIKTALMGILVLWVEFLKPYDWCLEIADEIIFPKDFIFWNFTCFQVCSDLSKIMTMP